MIEKNKLKAIVVLSGGLDSTTALYWSLQNYEVVACISFNYNQKHKIELEYAKKTCEKLKIKHYIQDINILDSRSCLTTDDSVPEGHYADENMNKTVVNNRNSIMFSLATSLCIDLEADRLVVGIHAGDHFIYPDCRTDFIVNFNNTMRLANQGFLSEEFKIIAPFVEMSKTDIAELALLSGIDESTTYSDYEGGKTQNSKSGTSVERIEAISEAYYRLDQLFVPYNESHKQDKTNYSNKEYALNLLKDKLKIKRVDEINLKINKTLNLFN
jgi:7-cyano-7-deazaguanine synthase